MRSSGIATPPRWSDRTARSTGFAFRDSTLPRALPHYWAVRNTDAGSWRRARKSSPYAAAIADHTLILETEFETAEGSARLIDFMPLSDERWDVVRIVEGVSGRITVQMELIVRFDYGSIVPWVHRTDDVLLITAGPDTLELTASTSSQRREHEDGGGVHGGRGRSRNGSSSITAPRIWPRCRRSTPVRRSKMPSPPGITGPSAAKCSGPRRERCSARSSP